MRARASGASAALLFGSLWGLAEATAGYALHALRVPGLAGCLMFPLGFLLMSRAYARNGRPTAAILTSWVAASIKLVDFLIPGADAMAVLNPAQAILFQGLAAAGLLSVFGTETWGRRDRLFFRKKESDSFSGIQVAGFRASSTERSDGNGFPRKRAGTKPNGTRLKMRNSLPALIAAAAAASLAWRMAHLGFSFLSTALLREPNILRAGSAPILRFLIPDSLVNGALVFIFMKASSSFSYFNKDRVYPEAFRLLTRPAASLAVLAAAVIAEAVL